MLSGLVRVVPPRSITAIVNVGDDTVLHGLHISPDLDTVTYTLAGLDNKETGWGVVGESWTVMDELARLGGESWFRLGDRDLATHLFRTERLQAGESLTEVTAAIASRRQIEVRLLPVTDDAVRTMLTLAEKTELGDQGTEVAFQDYFVRLHHDVAVRSVRFAGAEQARPAPAVMDAIASAERIVVCPAAAGRSGSPRRPRGAPGRHRRGLPHRRRGGAQGAGRSPDDRAGHGTIGHRRGPLVRALGQHPGDRRCRSGPGVRGGGGRTALHGRTNNHGLPRQSCRAGPGRGRHP
jgi:hypothetical protein